MSVLCTVCARSGSKGIPNKNLQLLDGRSLLAITLGQARDSGIFDTIAVSSDSGEILDAAKAASSDVCIDRSADLSSDVASKIAAIQNCVTETEAISGKTYDIVVDLDVTSPLREREDIQNCVRLLIDEEADNIITGVSSRKSPYFNLVERESDGSVRLVKPPEKRFDRRQDVPECFDMNASIYAWGRESLFRDEPLWQNKTKIYLMPEEAIDIDSPLDLAFVELVLDRRKNNTNES
ncbi:MAG: acylneuraminate cytidylyltransferase family protein [Candidatus Lindowbacteria bacterium]|nr:acylneuraminate cytidylyltransferase family protein [Candidatus Lindowbacteria bacterium]